MNIESFLTVPMTYFEGAVQRNQYQSDHRDHKRIIEYRFWKHLQQVSKIEPMPFLFADHDIGGFMTRSLWDNGKAFYVVDVMHWLPHESGSTRYLWTFAENEKPHFVEHPLDVFMEQMRRTCLTYNKFAILISPEGRVTSISNRGEDRVLTADAERIFRSANGSIGGNYSSTDRR